MKGPQLIVFAVLFSKLGQVELGLGPGGEFHVGSEDLLIGDGAQHSNRARRACGDVLFVLELGLVLLSDPLAHHRLAPVVGGRLLLGKRMAFLATASGAVFFCLLFASASGIAVVCQTQRPPV